MSEDRSCMDCHGTGLCPNCKGTRAFNYRSAGIKLNDHQCVGVHECSCIGGRCNRCNGSGIDSKWRS